MKALTEFIKNKIRRVRFSSLRQFEDSPAVNMTRILLNPKNILIIPYNRMGTILLATRVFKSIRDHYPTSSISVAAYEPWSALISKDPTIDRVFTFGDEIEDPFSRKFQQIGQMLKEQNFDLTFYLSYQFDPVMAYLIRLAGADLRVAFRNDYEASYFNVEIVPARGTMYEVERYLEMLRTLGIDGTVRDYTMKINDSIREKARMRFLPGYSSSRNNRYAGFDLTKEIAGNPIVKKDAEHAIGTLISGFDATVIVFFEPHKKTLAAELKETFGKKCILVEDRPISLVAGLMSFCQFVVTHNTDLFQLAVALKVPTIGVLTSEEMIQWSPVENTHLIHLELSGSWPSSTTINQTSKQLLTQTGQSVNGQ